MSYATYVDNLMGYYASGAYSAEAIQAKNEFFDLAGMFDEQSQNFEMKMSQFADWYLFMRPLSGSALPPARDFISRKPISMTDEELGAYSSLANSRASIFEFLKLSKSDLHVCDLFSKYRLVIKNSPITEGFAKQEYFQGRLIPHEDTFVFSTSFCFHPPEASKFILQEIKKVQKCGEAEQNAMREKLLVRLFRMRHKFDQYSHVGIQEIYSNESRLRI